MGAKGYSQLSAEGEEFPPPEWRPEKVSLCSRLVFHWVTPLILLGKNRQINQGDLPPLAAGKLHGQDLEIKPLVERFVEIREKAPREALFVPLLKVFKANIVLAWFFAVSEQACNLANPVLLRWFLSTFNEPTELSSESSGYELGVVMLLVSMLQTFLGNHGFLIISTLGVKQRAVIMTLLYRKALRLSNEARQESSVGQIVNLMSNDANRFPEFSMFVIRIWMVPIYLLVALLQLFSLLGAPALAGVIVLILGGWVNAQVMKRLHKLRTTQLNATDDRVMQTNEAILGIRIVKMNCWEEPIEKRIDEFRQRELSKLKTQERFIAGNRFAFFSIPIITALSTFVSYSVLGGQMTAEKVFTSMALFNIMQMYLQELPRAVATLTQVAVAQRRLSVFLDKSELDNDPTDVRKDLPSNDGFGSALIAENASFKWDDTTSVPVLSGVNFKANGGELAAVVGSVGAGKSTLISALLGELTKLTGRVELRGRVALCTQQPWLITATLKENILFGQPYDSSKFWDVIECCGLAPDLDQLPAAEETGIGEKGINLSGGQKARIALARACYRGADIFILDDVLAAVDVHVGEHLFKKCICGAMAGSTRILVTNALHVLPSCDSVSVVDNGTVAEHGPYAELVEKRGGVLASMVEAHSIKEDEKQEDSEHETVPKDGKGEAAAESKKDNSRVAATQQEAESGVLVKEEVRKKGKVGLDVYRRYLSAGASDCLVGCVLVFGFIAPEGMSGLASVWLSVWTSADVTAFSDTLYYLGVYAAITIGAMGLVFARAFTWAAVVVRAAGKIHAILLARVLRFPISFFDTTPTGRILNRFAHDVDQVDTQISQALEQQMEWSLRAGIALVLVCSILPSILVFMLPILWSLSKVGQLFRYTSREVRRLDSTTRSPIYAHFSETLSGLSTIRSFGDNHRFALQNEAKVEENLRVWFCHQLTHRWLNMRFDLISLVLQAAAAISCVYFRETMSAGLVGVVMVQSFASIRAFRLTLKTYVDVESKMTYAERVFEYSDLPTEPPAELKDDPGEETWPRDGQIEFRGVSMRYRDNLPLALDGVDLRIEARERVGICGRTGSGKSTMTMILFRMVKLASGVITIDGKDISTLGLKTLRRSLSIIPQDPVMFTGSLLDNLDPFRERSETEVWKALETVRLANWARGEGGTNGLELRVSEGGGNLSIGQRQLVCLARALIRQPAILILDEATASVDYETDRLIQAAIRAEFRGTSLTIAHRLNTVMDSDRIVVLEAGRVAEQGHPADMLDNEDGYLTRMVAATGERQAAYLKQLAHGECPETPRSSNEEEYPTDTGSNESDRSVRSPMGSQRSSSSWVDVDQSPMSQQRKQERSP